MRGLACFPDRPALDARALARTFVTGFQLLLLAASTSAQAPTGAATPDVPALQDSPTEQPLAVLLGKQTDSLGRTCALAQLARSGELRFLACGPAGLWVVRLHGAEAKLVEIRDVGGSATGLFTAETQLWVKVSSVRAQPIDVRATLASAAVAQPTAAQPAAAQPTAAPANPYTAPPDAQPKPQPPAAAVAPPTPPPSPDRRIVSRHDALITIDMPRGSEPPNGTRVSFTKFVPDNDGASEERVLAVGRVVGRTYARAKVLIGTNEEVPSDATARLTVAPATASTFAPPRAGGIWETSFLARPFLVLDDLGVGGVLDAQVGYRMRAPVHFEAALTPVAFGTARAGGTVAYAGMLLAAFDSHLFEAGLGIGIQSVNDPSFGLDRGSGTLIAQRLRIGARDGAYLELQAHVVLFHRSFEFSSLRATGQIPLGARTWLHVAGGGGTIGMASGELGIRQMVAGNGGVGSAFITALVGWAAVFRSCNDVTFESTCQELDSQGPMLGGDERKT